MRAADAALFGASWWPYASFETLKIATYLSIWVRLQVFLLNRTIHLQFRLTSSSYLHGMTVGCPATD
jgi:hypothetical protein